MKKRSVTHHTFCIERVYDASPARVFAAFAQAGPKRRWFVGDDEGWTTHECSTSASWPRALAGRRAAPTGGPRISYDAHYQDIVPEERIVLAYDMHMNDERISVSLMTVELAAEGKGTKLKLTEQDAFLDGHDLPAAREQGTRDLLEKLGATLKEVG